MNYSRPKSISSFSRGSQKIKFQKKWKPRGNPSQTVALCDLN